MSTLRRGEHEILDDNYHVEKWVRVESFEQWEADCTVVCDCGKEHRFYVPGAICKCVDCGAVYRVNIAVEKAATE